MNDRPRSFRPGSFGPEELRGADVPVSDAELAESFGTAREIEALLSSSEAIRPSADFASRVMGAVAKEPAPSAAAVLAPIRSRRDVRGFLQSVRDAWAFALSSSRPAPARAMALAYVLTIAVAATSLTGVAAFGAAGALGLIPPAPTQSQRADESLVPSIGPTASPRPTESLEPSEDPSVEPTESAEPTDSAEPDTSNTGGGGGEATDHPDGASTPRPSETHDAEDSPHPSSSSEDGSHSSDSTPKPSQTPSSGSGSDG